MKYKATDLASEAGIADPRWLISREFGKLFLVVLEDKLGLLQPMSTLVVDFTGISLLEWSFADESIATLCVKMLSGQYEGKYMVFEGLSDTSIENLSLAIRTRPEREKTSIRNLVVPVIHMGVITPIGKLEEHLKPVWEYISKTHEVTARDITAILGMEISTASTKLKTLYDLRLLKREETKTDTGKQYIYHKI